MDVKLTADNFRKHQIISGFFYKLIFFKSIKIASIVKLMLLMVIKFGLKFGFVEPTIESLNPLQNRVPGYACERRRGRMKRAEVGAAVEKREEKRKPAAFFGHRKRATSNPSAPAKTSLKIRLS